MKEQYCIREYIMFHGYKIYRTGIVIGKKGAEIKTTKRHRRGGGYDLCVKLYYNGKTRKWTLQRLIAACFLGPIDGYEINHKDRNPLNNNLLNLEHINKKMKDFRIWEEKK